MVKTNLVDFDIRGNIIDPSWYSHICFPNGKPNLNAIIILGEIVYWYRPKIIRDESTGRIIEVKKRFKGDFLQRSRKTFEEQFGLSEKQVREALRLLEDLNLIKRHLKVVQAGELTLGNVLLVAKQRGPRV